VLEVNAPRPRSLGVTANAGELDRVSAELHELLFARELDAGSAPAALVDQSF
jgi:hypothetical protein